MGSGATTHIKFSQIILQLNGYFNQFLINYIKKNWHYFYEKYKKLLTKLIILSFSLKIFQKKIPKPLSLGIF